jgi:hypothetical protein
MATMLWCLILCLSSVHYSMVCLTSCFLILRENQALTASIRVLQSHSAMLHCVLRVSIISYASVHTSQTTNLVTLATNTKPQLFLLHQHTPHRKYSSNGNQATRMTHSHQGCQSHVVLHTHKCMRAVKLHYNIMKGTEHFVLLQTSVVLTEEYNVITIIINTV